MVTPYESVPAKPLRHQNRLARRFEQVHVSYASLTSHPWIRVSSSFNDRIFNSRLQACLHCPSSHVHATAPYLSLPQTLVHPQRIPSTRSRTMTSPIQEYQTFPLHIPNARLYSTPSLPPWGSSTGMSSVTSARRTRTYVSVQ